MLLATGLLLAGCSSLDATADFSNNELFFVDVPFATKAPGDRAVFVAPIHDDRASDALPQHERGFPIRYGSDDFWVRPVSQMLAEVLERHLDHSGLFPSITTQASPESLILKPSLVSFAVGAREVMAGSISFAEVGLRVEVFGPVDDNGERPLWHDEIYGNQQVSKESVHPVNPYRLIGRALQITMSRTLSGLDGSNVGRSQVPVAAILPADAAPKPEAASAAPSKD